MLMVNKDEYIRSRKIQKTNKNTLKTHKIIIQIIQINRANTNKQYAKLQMSSDERH